MKQSARSEAGMTMIELLAAVSISLLIIGAIYTVFLTGIRAYERIGIENDLRSEADYAMARIMNELYTLSPDGMESQEEKTPLTAVTFVKNQEFKADADTGLVSREKKKPESIERMTMSIQDGALAINGETITSSRFLLDDSSSFSFRCARKEGNLCRSGVMTIRLIVSDRRHADPSGWLYVPPFTLTTEFGF